MFVCSVHDRRGVYDFNIANQRFHPTEINDPGFSVKLFEKDEDKAKRDQLVS